MQNFILTAVFLIAQAVANPTTKTALELNADRLSQAANFEEAKTILTREPELATVELAKSLGARGDQVFRARNLDEAERLYRLSVEVATRSKDELELARSRFGLAIVNTNRGEYETALREYDEILPTYLKLASPIGIASLYNSIALVQSRLGNIERALELQKESLRWSEQSKDQESIARSLFNLGIQYVRVGDYRNSLQALTRSMEISEAQKIDIGVAFAANGIGSVYREQGNYEMAMSFYKKSLDLKEKIGNYSEIIVTLLNMAATEQDLENHDVARSYMDRALQMNRENDPLTLIDTLYRYGVFLSHNGQAAEAIERLKKCVELSGSVGERLTNAAALLEIGHAYIDLHDYAQALDFGERAAQIATDVHALPLQATAYDLIGVAAGSLKGAVRAEAAFKQAIDAIEERQFLVAGAEDNQQEFLETQITTYDHMIGFLVSEKRFHEAFTFVERKKAKVLLSVLGRERANVAQSMTESEVQREHALLSKVSWINGEMTRVSRAPDNIRPALVKGLTSQLDAARLDLAAFNTSLYASHPELQTKRVAAAPINVADTLALLPDRQTLLLEYAVTEHDTYLFAISRDHNEPRLRMFRLGVGSKSLDERVQALQRQLGERDPAFRQNAAALYALLIAPAANELRGKETVVISPDGPLWQLSFQALTDRAEHYLIENHSISLAPSLTVLIQMSKSNDRRALVNGQIFAMGSPAIDPVPNAEREVNALASIYGSAQSHAYVGVQAREATAKAEASNASLVHFATHGVFDDKHPMYSYLVLAPDANADGQDGRLEAREIMNMKLKSNLVVLSACESGRGLSGSSDGLIGMTWAFFIAGSPTTVASQWKVASASTTDLMIQFHRSLKNGAGKAKSLRQAMLSVMQKPEYRHPFYWAPFVLVGDGN